MVDQLRVSRDDVRKAYELLGFDPERWDDTYGFELTPEKVRVTRVRSEGEPIHGARVAVAGYASGGKSELVQEIVEIAIVDPDDPDLAKR